MRKTLPGGSIRLVQVVQLSSQLRVRIVRLEEPLSVKLSGMLDPDIQLQSPQTAGHQRKVFH